MPQAQYYQCDLTNHKCQPVSDTCVNTPATRCVGISMYPTGDRGGPKEFRVSVGGSGGDYYDYVSCMRNTNDNLKSPDYGKPMGINRMKTKDTADYECQPAVTGDPIHVEQLKEIDTSKCGHTFQHECGSRTSDYKLSSKWTITFPRKSADGSTDASGWSRHGIDTLTFSSGFPNLFEND